MEPGFNPALEKQAVGRVHRLGQKREVEIVRLLIKNSVESRIRVFLDKKYGEKTELVDDEENENAGVGPVGNIATERPKSAIMADDFDILFGVKVEDQASSGPANTELDGNSDEAVPDAAFSADL